VTLPFKLVTYTVTFNETGLSTHHSWQVTFAGKTTSLTGSKTTFTVSNGTYAFTMVASGYTYVATPPSPLTVSGGNAGVSVKFTAV
jgi:hypothetical protein